MDTDNTKLYPNCDATVWLRSCHKEIIEPISGQIKGVIPEWLNGDLIRNGPGSLEVGQDKFQHLFDSSALLHKFSIRNGNVTYQCRFLESEVYKKNKKANRIVITEFGTKSVPDPCQTIFKRVAAVFNWKENQSDNAMISVYPFGDELYAFTESPVIHRINQDNLKTEKRVDVSENVAIVNHTSHPHVVTGGTVFNLAMSITKTGPHHNIVCFPAKSDILNADHSMFEQAHIVADIPARWSLHPSYMHTFGLTEKYFIIVEQPLSLSLPSLIMKRIHGEPMAGSLQWYGDEMTQINVIERKTGKLLHTFYSEAFFYLHIINQYEISDHIVLDICSYKDASMLECMYIEAMKNMQRNPNYSNMFRSLPIRLVLPLFVPKEYSKEQNLITLPNTKAQASFLPDGKVYVKSEKLCDLGCETPRIHYEKYLGKQYQFYYAISADVDAENPGTVIKVDVENKSTLTWCEKNCYPSEPIFVPKPNPKDEDDGVVVAAMVWGFDDTNHIGLIVLDAKSFIEVGRAEFYTSSPVPKCLHGWFLPQQKQFL